MSSFIRGILVGALAVAFVFVVLAYQAAGPKFGTVDIKQLARDSKIGKAEEQKFKDQAKLRDDLLQHFNDYPCYDNTQRDRVRELWLKQRTQQEESELEVLRTAGQSLQNELTTLQQKKDATEAEKQRMEELQGRYLYMYRTYLPQLQQSLTVELDNMKTESLKLIYEQVRAATQKVGKAQAFTMVFDADVAPFCENDISAAVLAELNK